MSLDLILRVGTKLILPFVLLFALYVQFHGDFGPGGGFQAGVIMAGMVIMGKNYLDYSVFSQDSAHGHELGIFLVEAGVLITVAGTMTALFYAFVERGR